MDSAHASHATPLADDAPVVGTSPRRIDDLPASPFTDAERYAWIRGNRGNFLIFDALSRANFDRDFDALIDAAMQSHSKGRHIPALPMAATLRRRRSDWE